MVKEQLNSWKDSLTHERFALRSSPDIPTQVATIVNSVKFEIVKFERKPQSMPYRKPRLHMVNN